MKKSFLISAAITAIIVIVSCSKQVDKPAIKKGSDVMRKRSNPLPPPPPKPTPVYY